jgi:hypothetical protein
VFFGRSISGCISEISPGECVTIKTIHIMGIGTININVQIDIDTISANCYLLGLFVFLK